MEHFLPAILGGLLIGASASALMLFNGKTAGISGMVRGLATPPWPQQLERLLFLAGMVGGAWLVQHLTGQPVLPREGMPAVLLGFAGLLVGLGTALANGCTSGHGVCGMARLSPRSAVAVLVFLVVAMVTTHVARHHFAIV